VYSRINTFGHHIDNARSRKHNPKANQRQVHDLIICRPRREPLRRVANLSDIRIHTAALDAYSLHIADQGLSTGVKYRRRVCPSGGMMSALINEQLAAPRWPGHTRKSSNVGYSQCATVDRPPGMDSATEVEMTALTSTEMRSLGSNVQLVGRRTTTTPSSLNNKQDLTR
jgi:hypothetical protein